MMINMNRILNDDRLVRAVTGLSIIGFNELSCKFANALQNIKQE